MSTDPRTDAQPSAPHAAGRHDLVRVQGARENNLKDVSTGLPKSRLTVFTGVSGSGSRRSARPTRTRSTCSR